MNRRAVAALAVTVAVSATAAAQQKPSMAYPDTAKGAEVDDYFGTKIADPYRWLEDDNSPATKAWVEAQNKLTFAYLAKIPERPGITKRLTELWNYERYGAPSKEGTVYVFSRNTGLQKQSVIYKTEALHGTPLVLLDPNKLSKDGTVAVSGGAFTQDGRYFAYATSSGGSDWMEWHVKDVATTKDLPDAIKWSKFSGAAWKKDGSGFYYSRFSEPRQGEALTGVNELQKVYFHKLGTPQSKDELVYERADKPDWMFGADVTDDGRFLLIYQYEGTEPKNRVFVRDLNDPNGKIEPVLDQFDAEYVVVGNDGDRFYVRTTKDAPRSRLVAIDRQSAAPTAWKTLIGEPAGKDVLTNVSMVANRFVAVFLTDAHERVKIHALDGAFERDVPLPAMGSVGGFIGRRRDKEGFYAFTSFTFPTTIYRYDFAAGTSSVFKKPQLKFKPEDYTTEQVFYSSKDGTKVPMFLTYRKGLKKDGQNPTYLYGYGGFSISLTPSFSVGNLGWLELGGILAVANLRGGAEYGEEWHDAGRLHKKQNVFDDFIAAAEYLIAEKYTSTAKLAIAGGSNGGLLVGAAITQRPELFGAALPAVGVLDMLRFHKFTIGRAWVSDYGSADTKEGFDTLIKYSPLHNIKPGVAYPATLITTGDHDDRVVPAHSFKFAAALQAAQAGEKPILIRIETSAGHGAGKPVDKMIEEKADQLAFLVHELGMSMPPKGTQ